MNKKVVERFLEFFIIGLLMGIAEDAIAVVATTGAHVSWKMIGIIALVALPFAAFSELIVDKTAFFGIKRRKRRKKK